MNHLLGHLSMCRQARPEFERPGLVGRKGERSPCPEELENEPDAFVAAIRTTRGVRHCCSHAQRNSGVCLKLWVVAGTKKSLRGGRRPVPNATRSRWRR